MAQVLTNIQSLVFTIAGIAMIGGAVVWMMTKIVGEIVELIRNMRRKK